MHKLITKSVMAVSALALIVTATACSDPTAADKDAATSQQNTGKLITNQPVQAGKYSPTRAQINNWNSTWQSAPGKLAYTYLFNQGQNKPIGYYVLSGPPVSYAAGATQSYTKDCDADGCVLMPNPGQDGAFYNTGSGTNQFYGMDATTHRELEWGGTGVWYLLSDKPLRIDAVPLGDTK